MAEVVLVVPEDGSEVASPDMQWLREMVLHGGEDFWCSGSGQGWMEHPAGAELLIGFASEYGFFPEYVDRQRNYWVAFSDKEGGGKAPIWIGGDPIIVFERFFVAPELMCAVVEEFCSSGDRTRQVNWKRRSDVAWSFAYWDHPDVKR